MKMKKLLFAAAACLSLAFTRGQQIKISQMTTTTDPTGAYVPVIRGGINYKLITDSLMYRKLDSVKVIHGTGDTVVYYKYNGTRFTAGIISTAPGGITSLNTLTGASQTFATGTSGSDFGISSTGTVHTFNIPVASASATGKLSSTDWSTFNNKQSALTFSTGLTNTTGTVTNNLSTGVSGGQTAIGGTASGNNLILSSTSHSTKGKVMLGSSTGFVYDENLNAIGIGGSPVSAATGKFYMAGHTGVDIQLAGIQNGDFAIGNIASAVRQAAIVTRNTNDASFMIMSGTTDANTTGDIAFNVRLHSSADFTTMANPAFIFSRFSTTLVTILRNGKIGVNGITPTSFLDASGATGYDQLRLRTSYTPTSSSDTNGNTGDISWDSGFIYVKTGSGWKRAALSTF